MKNMTIFKSLVPIIAFVLCFGSGTASADSFCFKPRECVYIEYIIHDDGNEIPTVLKAIIDIDDLKDIKLNFISQQDYFASLFGNQFVSYVPDFTNIQKFYLRLFPDSPYLKNKRDSARFFFHFYDNFLYRKIMGNVVLDNKKEIEINMILINGIFWDTSMECLKVDGMKLDISFEPQLYNISRLTFPVCIFNYLEADETFLKYFTNQDL